MGLGRAYEVRHPLNVCTEEHVLDLADPMALAVELKKIGPADAVIHCAAMISWDSSRAAEVHRMNVDGVHALAESCLQNGVRHLIFISAGSRFGFADGPDVPVDERVETIPPSRDPYASSKYEAEQVLRGYSDRLRITILYPSTVYGPGDMKMNSGTLVKMSSSRTFPLGFPGGTSWVDVRDFSRAVQLVLDSEPGDEGIERYIISTENIRYRDLFRRLRRCFSERPGAGIPVPMWTRPFALLAVRMMGCLPGFKKISLFNVTIFEGFFRFRYFSASRAKHTLLWEPEITLEDSVSAAVEFYKANGLWES